MKKLFALSLSLLLVTPLIGQDPSQDAPDNPETMENADMSDGATHWQGDAKVAGADNSTDFVTNSGGASKGIQVDLHSSTWTKVTQELHGLKVPHATHGNYLLIPTLKLTITYQTSTDFTTSTRDTDYSDLDIGKNLGFDNARLRAQPGKLIAFVDCPNSQTTALGNGMILNDNGDRIAAIYIDPKTVQQPQTITATLAPRGNEVHDMTFCLALPPGKGNIVITKISLIQVPATPSQ